MARQARTAAGARRRLVRGAAPLAVLSLLALAGCSSSSDSTASTTSAGAGAGAASTAPDADLGAPKPATGAPVVFGNLSLESGPITFPEARASAEAAIKYVNEYRGGIGGRPIALEHCITDNTPATSGRCANQVLDKNPVAILGTLDAGVPGAMPVWLRANKAYLGGVTLTPVETNSPNAVEFSSVSVGDTAAAAVYTGQKLKAKSVAVISSDDTQGQIIANTTIIPTLKNAGVPKVTSVTYPLTAADLTSQMATAVSSNPDVIFVGSPSACVNAFRALKTVGSTAKLVAVGQCATPEILAAVNGAAEGMVFASPYQSPAGDAKDASLFRAIMKKYAPTVKQNDVAIAGFATVMNVQAALGSMDPATLTTESILGAFKTGGEHPSFMTHPYTCDGKQLAKATSVCDAHELLYQVKNGKIVPLDGENYSTPGQYYTG